MIRKLRPVVVETEELLAESSKIIRYNQCQQFGDKFYMVELNPYGNELLERLTPIVVDPDTIETGVYTFVVLSLGHEEVPKLYMMKTLNFYEIGTKHQQLINRIACIKKECVEYVIYYAGELFKTPKNNILFNFSSGTYMKDKLHEEETPEGIEYITNTLHELTGSKYDIEFTKFPLITNQILPLTLEDIKLYLECGAIIREFSSKIECVSYKEFYNRNKHNLQNETIQKQMEELLGNSVILTKEPRERKGGKKRKDKPRTKGYTHTKRHKLKKIIPHKKPNKNKTKKKSKYIF